MGRYNPHSPIILGEEWVGIRDEDLVFSPSVNVVELGHTFALATSRQVRDARFYTHKLGVGQTGFQTTMIGIYPAGAEAQTGPINSVIIPCNGGTITGATGVLTGASSVADAVARGTGDKWIQYGQGANAETSFFFATNQYPHLAGKRILNVSLLYSGTVQDQNALQYATDFVDPDPGSPVTNVYIRNDAGTQSQEFFRFWLNNTGSLDQLVDHIPANVTSGLQLETIDALNLGDISHFWSVTLGPNSNDKMPWTYTDLQRFEASAANRLHIHLITQVPTTALGNNAKIMLDYVALRVLYCEEQRLVYGGRKMATYTEGVNVVTLRDTSRSADPILAAGEYTATLSYVNPGDVSYGIGTSSEFPLLNALRELYTIPTHTGVQVNIPYPLEDHLGETFVVEQTHVLPQLSIHLTGGGPLTEVHAYGRQAAAQVYGTNTPEQELYDDVSGVSATYPQARFYARRFGDTEEDLAIAGTGATTGAGAISVADFDALPEIVDGWKEVTIRLTTPAVLGTLTTPDPTFRWDSPGTTKGNRWEIMGVSAPAISGVPGNLYNLAPAAQQLYAATYEPPGGAQASLSWMPQGVASTFVTSGSDDQATDAVLLFSQDPPMITGLALSLSSQPVSGFSECGHGPCCTPSAISYHHITWPIPTALGVLRDTFTRSVVSGIGTADTGQTTTTVGGIASEYNVNGSQAVLTLSPSGTRHTFVYSGAFADLDETVTITPSDVSSTEAYVSFRYTDINNTYALRVNFSATGSVSVRILRIVGGVTGFITAQTSSNASCLANESIKVRVQMIGGTIKVKVWNATLDEPAQWTADGVDATYTSGAIALGAVHNALAGTTMTFDNLLVIDPLMFGSYELQRSDTVDTDWKTIMSATSSAVTSFNDYEARVGVMSSYRIRAVNALDFVGLWSPTITGTITEPGITLPSCGSSKRGVLIFTSNEVQDGSRNLAYAMTWEGEAREEFSFNEAGSVEFVQHFDRDFQIMFHGDERGGETFSRTLLLANAAVPLPRLANIHSLRDLAWDDLSYVCVRDDIGDRWLAGIVVPNASVRRRRRLYNADITIVEVTDTPSPVDPS